MTKILLTILCSLTLTYATAQGFFSATYDISVPLGKTSDYINSASFRGFGLQSRTFLADNVSIGGGLGWHIMYENMGELQYHEENLTITGIQYRYVNSFPLVLNAHYYTGTDGDIRWYAGGGIGLAHIIERTEIGLYAIENTGWNFVIAPEVGVLIPVNFNNSINLSVVYHNAFKGGDIDTNTGYLTFKVGVAFMK
jgi:hypothetical protein